MKRIIFITTIFLTSFSIAKTNNDWKSFKIIPDIKIDLPCVPKKSTNKTDNYASYECNSDGITYKVDSTPFKVHFKGVTIEDAYTKAFDDIIKLADENFSGEIIDKKIGTLENHRIIDFKIQTDFNGVNQMQYVRAILVTGISEALYWLTYIPDDKNDFKTLDKFRNSVNFYITFENKINTPESRKLLKEAMNKDVSNYYWIGVVIGVIVRLLIVALFVYLIVFITRKYKKNS